MRFLRRSLTGLFLLSLTAGLLAYAGQMIRGAVLERQAQEDRPFPSRERVFAVNVVRFEPETAAPVMNSFGEVRSRRTLEVRATAGGTVVALAGAFEEGGRVRQGDLLLQVDASDAQSALDVAVTDLAEAEAELRESAAALELAHDDVASAREQLALREQALARQRNLKERGAGTEASVETAALAEASAKQAVLSRRQALAQAEARADRAENALARRRIALAEAERDLADTELYAEFSGTLSDVTAVQGGLVQNNERLARLVDPDALEVVFRVSNAEYARLLDDSGQLIAARVEAALDVSGVDLTAEGIVERESAAVGEGQTGRLLFARIDDANGFRPGDFVAVRIAEPELPFVARLPATAVDAAGTVLVLNDDGRLEEADVEVVRRQGDDVLARADRLRGREVVAERLPLLGAGIKVRPLRSIEAGPAESASMVVLSEERRARLIAFVEDNDRMPEAAKQRILAQLSKPEVPLQVVEGIESRMGSHAAQKGKL